MRSCIAVLYIALFCAPPSVHAQADPDALYRARADLAQAREAAAAWETRLAANPKDFESSWKLARTLYWLGGHGDKKKSEEHLRRSLRYDADSTASRYFLAETLFDLDRDREAIEELNKVLAAPINPEWEPEDRELKEQARRLLNAPVR